MATDIQKEYIVGLVVGMFNAAPGQTFLGEFENAIDAGLDFKQLADFLEATPQFQNDVLGGDNSVANQVAVLMDHFGLTSGNTDPASPDAQAEAFFNARLDQGATFGDIVIEAGLYLLGEPAPEFAETAALFQNKMLVARLYSEENSDDNVADLQAVLTDVTTDGPATEEDAIAYLVAHGFVPPDGEPGEPGETFALTLNQDNLGGTANNDTFNAPLAQDFKAVLVNTLQDADVLDGLEGTDTLNATVNSGGTVAPTLTSIENVNLRSIKDGSGIDFSNSTGVAKVTSANSTETTAINGAGDIASFAVNNQTKTVTVTGSTATAINLSFNKFGTEDVAGVLDFNTGATSATVTTADSNVDVQNLASVKTLSVNATGENALASASAGTTESLTVSGTGSVEFVDDLTALKTLDSTAEGGVTVTGLEAAFETATTGAGGDSITVAAATGVKNISTGAGNDNVSVTGVLGATAVVDLGVGDDTLTLNTPPSGGVTLTGGEGTDTLQTSSADYDKISGFTEENLAKITGFEVLSISNVLADKSTTDVSKIAGIGSFVAAAGVAAGGKADVTGLAADASVEIAGGNVQEIQTVDFTGTTRTDGDITVGGITVAVLAADTAEQTAAKVQAALNNQTLTAPASGGAVTAAVLGAVVTVTFPAAAGDVADIGVANGTSTITGDVTVTETQKGNTGAAGELAIAMATDTAADVINLKLNNNYTENNDATSTITPLTHNVDASKVETLNVESTGTASEEFKGNAGTEADGVNNTLSLTNNDLVTLNVTGDQAFTFTSTAAMTKLATIDVSALTASATIDANAALNTSAALTITGSATASNMLTGGAGKDTIVGGAEADVITGGPGGDTLTGGDGNDSFIFGASSSTIGTGTFDTITDFSANTFGNGGDGTAGTGAGAVDDRTGDVLQFTQIGNTGGFKVDVLNSAADATTFLATNITANTVVAALDASNSNLYVDNTGDGVADFFIHLNGVTTIDAAAFQLAV